MIKAENISFAVGDFRLSDLSLQIEPRSYFVLLGPPGSGKTIFLECLCGLKTIDSGRIYIGDSDVTGLEPRARNIGYVPQDYALFPHLSVRKNIAFGLRGRGLSGREVAGKIEKMAQMLGISRLLDRRVPGLSGGEKQRTALARALVLEPRVLLLDEPVCALDEVTRHSICALLHKIQQKLELTVIHVSHNLEEAFSVADRAAILNEGAIQQTGLLSRLMRKPANEFVARFMRCENVFDGRVCEGSDGRTVEAAGIKLAVDSQCGGEVKLAIRPEDVQLTAEPPAKTENAFEVEMVRCRDYGGYVRVEVAGSIQLVAHLTHSAFAGLNAAPNDMLRAVLNPEKLHVLGC